MKNLHSIFLIFCLHFFLPQYPALAQNQPLLVKKVQSFLKDVEARPDLEEATKAKVVELYQNTLTNLRLAEEWEVKAKEIERANQRAPSNLKKIQAQLSKPQKEPKLKVPPKASLSQLEQLLNQAETQLKTARDKVEELDKERKRRAERRGTLPGSIAHLQKKLDALSKKIGAPSPKDETPELTRAKQSYLPSQKMALERELEFYDNELASYEVGTKLLTASRDLASRELSQAEALAHLWMEAVNERRRVEAEKEAKEAEEVKKEAEEAHPLVGKVAKENAVWAERRAGDRLADRIEKTAENFQNIVKTLNKLNSDYQSISSKVEAAGLTHSMGLLLRRQLSNLPDLRTHRKAASARQREISDVQVQLIELTEERTKLADIELLIRDIMREIDPATPGSKREAIESAIRELLKTRRDYSDSLINDYNSYFVKLVDTDAEERRLIEETKRFSEYIGQRVLWIPSSAYPRFSDFSKMWEAVRWMGRSENWSSTFSVVWASVKTHPLFILITLPFFFGYRQAKRKVRDKVKEIGEAATQNTAFSFLPTINALAFTIMTALFWPLLIWLTGFLIESSPMVSDFPRALGLGLKSVAIAFFLGEMFRQISVAKGLGRAHFGWPVEGLKVFRRELTWLMTFGLPIVFIVSMMEWHGEASWRNSLGRFAFIGGQILLMFFARRVSHPVSGAFADKISLETKKWVLRLSHGWYMLSMGIPFALAVLSIAGYYYTALQLVNKLHSSLWLVLGLVIVNAIVLRWLLVSKRMLAHQKALEHRKILQEEKQEAETSKKEGEKPQEPDIDISSIGDQVLRLLRTIIALALLFGLWLVWKDVLPALGILDNVVLWNTSAMGTEVVTGAEGAPTLRSVEHIVPTTLGDLLLSLFILMATFAASKNIPGLLEFTILRLLSLQPGERYAIKAVVRYAITIIGILFAFGTIGVGWSKVQWLAAAITVGLGFGLQEIFANFVSGMILFFERPIRVDDIVTVGDVEGKVTQINIRATTIRDWNRKELVVPNKEFVTGKFINWTLADPISRIVIPVGIAYGSDTALAQKLLLQIAVECPHVLDDPKPKSVFKGFGDSALMIELRAFIPNLDHWADAMNELHTTIDQEFKKAGIEIAFPQMDVHIRSIKEALTISERNNKDNSL